MKKFAVILLVVLMVMNLAACVQETEPDYGEYAPLIKYLEKGKYDKAKEWIDKQYGLDENGEETEDTKEEGGEEEDPEITGPTDGIQVPTEEQQPPVQETNPPETVAAERYIYTAQELFEMEPAEDVTYILAADIDLSGYAQTIERFTGVLEGNGHVLFNAEAPLFFQNDGTIYNLNMFECKIELNSDAAAIAVENSGLIFGCAVTGNVSSTALNACAGGISGRNYGVIEKCENYAKVYARSYALNEIGNPINGTWSNSGGISAWNDGEILRCYNAGEIFAEGAHYISSAGGLVSMNHGAISNCYNTGAIGAREDSGFADAGGISAYNEGDRITYCYNIGQCTAGLVGDNRSYLIDCYYLDSVSERGASDDAGERIFIFSADQLTDESTFSTFDFDTVWVMTENGPVLQ